VTKIVTVADVHGGATHMTTLLEQERALAGVAELCAVEKAELLLVAGDLFDHNRPTADVIKMLGRFFERLGIPTVISKGNHDPDSAEIARYFRGHVIVPNEPEVVAIHELDIAVLPYLPDRHVRARAAGVHSRDETARLLTQAVREILQGFKAKRREGVPMVLLAHGTVAGSVTSTGWQMGFIPGTGYVIPVEELEPFALSLVGHVHRPQEASDRILIPGSLLPLDFGEVEPKRAVVAEFVNGTMNWRSVELATPRVRMVEIAGRGQLTDTLAIVADPAEEMTRDLVGAKVKVQVAVDEATAREFPPARIEAALRAAGASLVQVELTVERPDRERAGVAAEAGPMGALARYLEDREDLEASARERITALGQEVVAELEGTHPLGAGGDLDLVAIEAQDLMGVRDARVEFDGHGVVTLTGQNGAGKSTIGTDALRVALFGASRYGAKPSPRLIRAGADSAMAAVTLRAPGGETTRVVRKLKLGTRGTVSATLDVLQRNGAGWHPLSDGKIASGELQVARLLGDLTDETLMASSVAAQRQQDVFTRARPEDRKRILAQAAGLQIYDTLADSSRERLRVRERDLALLSARAAPLRDQVAVIAELVAEQARAEFAVGEAREKMESLERDADAATRELERTRDRVVEYDRVQAETQELQRQIDALDLDLANWGQKHEAALAILAERQRLTRARADLATGRAEIVVLEAQLIADAAAIAARQDAIGRRQYREEQLRTLRSNRDQESRGFDHLIEQARRKGALIEEAVCCAPEPDCVFLHDARKALAEIPDFETKLAARAEPSEAESALIQELLELVIPDAPDPGVTKGKLTKARKRAAELEGDAAVAEKIAKAEQVEVEYQEAVARVRAQRDPLVEKKTKQMRTLLMFGIKPSVQNAYEAKLTADGFLQQGRRVLGDLQERAAEIRGRIAALDAVRADLQTLEHQIAGGAEEVAALDELTRGWRAARVLVLESNVIPQVEETANEILRRFPHGLQIALTTQRERRSGDGMAETLEVEVLGKGGVYEGCSGGEQTVLDFATHVALALVVSRRALRRLRLLVCDEPEGLDARGRAAFAATVRWISEELSLRALVMSHADDIVDALGGQRIDVVVGPDGSTVEVAA
jgi:exonuclease SbcD